MTPHTQRLHVFEDCRTEPDQQRRWFGWQAGKRDRPQDAVSDLAAVYTERYGRPPVLVVTAARNVHSRTDGIIVCAPAGHLEPACLPGEYWAEVGQ